MAARLAQPAQSSAGAASPSAVRELIVIPEIPNTINLQHAIQQVSSTVVEVNGDSSGHSSPTTTEAQHTYITVAMNDDWQETAMPVKAEIHSDQESEGSNGVNYHVQYVEPQEIYTQESHMETLRTYPVYNVTTVPPEGSADTPWSEEFSYNVVVGADEAPPSPAPAPHTPPAAPHTPHTPPQPRMPPATVQWLLDNYETADGVSLPRSTLYAHYLRHCATHRLDPVNAASFGKLIRSVFVGLRTRRLGTRGNSKYHYNGIRAKSRAAEDAVEVEEKHSADVQEPVDRTSEPEGVSAGAGGGPGAALHRQYLGAVGAVEPPALALHANDVPPAALPALLAHHREHGVEFLEAVAALDIAAVERSRRNFWRRPPPELCRRVLCRLAAKREVAAWLRRADLELYQKAVEMLLPDVLRPIPSQLTQAIRNFAKSLESALAAGSGCAPAAAARAQASAAAALSAALRRYTSLNHLAQAARAVLANAHQIHQMLSDLNRVDFRVVREQAAWACSCGAAATAHRLEADFKATLGRGASLEQWAAWLEGCVRGALAAHERKADYTARARRLLLDWSFYSSLVIRELTLRSAASFGSFHLIRLLYDEYVSYLIERRVAAHLRAPPIAVMQRAPEEEESIPEDGNRDDEDDPDWDWGSDDDSDEPDGKKLKQE